MGCPVKAKALLWREAASGVLSSSRRRRRRVPLPSTLAATPLAQADDDQKETALMLGRQLKRWLEDRRRGVRRPHLHLIRRGRQLDADLRAVIRARVDDAAVETLLREQEAGDDRVELHLERREVAGRAGLGVSRHSRPARREEKKARREEEKAPRRGEGGCKF